MAEKKNWATGHPVDEASDAEWGLVHVLDAAHWAVEGPGTRVRTNPDGVAELALNAGTYGVAFRAQGDSFVPVRFWRWRDERYIELEGMPEGIGPSRFESLMVEQGHLTPPL
jgi:hypothetical protein